MSRFQCRCTFKDHEKEVVNRDQLKASRLLLDHHLDDISHFESCLPAQSFLCLCRNRPADQKVGGAEEGMIYFDMITPSEAKTGEGGFGKCFQGIGLSRCNHIVVRLLLLQHQPHGFHILGRPAPVSSDGNVAEEELFFASRSDAAGCCDNFPGNKSLRPERRFVVEENAGAGE